jgi:hypothetical protein
MEKNSHKQSMWRASVQFSQIFCQYDIGILLPKLFRPTVDKNVQINKKFKITRTNSKRSEQCLLTK